MTVCTSSLNLMSVPRLVERSPALVKANMAVAASTAVKNRALPSVLPLYGTRQTPQKRHCGNSGTLPFAAAVDDSPDFCLRKLNPAPDDHRQKARERCRLRSGHLRILTSEYQRIKGLGNSGVYAIPLSQSKNERMRWLHTLI